MGRFAGRHGLITGGGGEIGRAVALRMAGAGAHVTVVDVDGNRADETVRLVVARGGTAQAVVADVTDEESVPHYVSAAACFGSIDMFFNNAGAHGPVARLVDTEITDFRSILEVNVTGVFLGLKHVLPCWCSPTTPRSSPVAPSSWTAAAPPE